MGNRNGTHSVKFENGDQYSGQWKSGKRDGHGTYVYANGDRYEGQYRENKRNGRGVFEYADKSKYVGEYRSDRKHGLGVYTYPNGAMYEGAWLNGKKHGPGTHTFPSGARYDGAYKGDQMDGHGTYTYEDGEWYSGTWREGKMHGEGKLKEKGCLSLVKHDLGVLLSKEVIQEDGLPDMVAHQAAQNVLNAGSFSSFSTANPAALQMVEVTVCQARNLARTDFFGLSDPYAVLQIHEVNPSEPPAQRSADWTGSKLSQRKTRTCHYTLDPQWNASFSFVLCNDRAYTLNLNVWDWDLGKSDDILGDLTLPLGADMFDNQDRWFDLQNCPTPKILHKAQSDKGAQRAKLEGGAAEGPVIGRSSSFKTHKKERSASFHQEGKPLLANSGVSQSAASTDSPDGRPGLSLLSPRRVFGKGDSKGDKGKGEDQREAAQRPTLPPQVQLRVRLVPSAHWEVTVLQARNLPRLDVFGKADPYCVLRWFDGLEVEEDEVKGGLMHWTGNTSSKLFKTSTRRNTLAPVWNDSFLFPIHGKPSGEEELKLSVWDWDLGKADDFVGTLRIPVDKALRMQARKKPFVGTTCWYKVTDDEKGRVSAWNSGNRGSKDQDGVENEPEVQVRFRIVKRGTIEQWTIGDKTRSLREASVTVSEAFELWELEDMCRVWYNTHPSGLVDRVQFTSYATEFLQLPLGAEEHIERMFGLIDQNNDGVLSFSELSLAMATLARGSIEEKLELGFRLNDLNGDGFISGEEVWKAVHVLWLSGGAMEDDQGSNNDNELAKQFLQVADTDGDDRISMDEYKAVALSDARFLKRMARDSAIVEFNRSPIQNLNSLLDACDRPRTEAGVAACLKESSHVNRIARGEVLGAVVEGYDMEAVGRLYMLSLGLEGKDLDVAMRGMLGAVHPPDDMAAMERVFRSFSGAMVAANPGLAGGSSDAVYAGVLAVIRLNVSIHGSGEAAVMTQQDFVCELRGAFHCDALGADMLDGIYKRVAKDEIVMGMASVADAVLAELIAQATLGHRKALVVRAGATDGGG